MSEQDAVSFDGPFLDQLSPEELSFLERVCTRRSFSRGDVIVREGEPAREVMFLRSGRLKACGWRSGHEVILSIVDPGALLGEVSAADGAPRSATLIALEPAELDCMTTEEFASFLGSHPTLMPRLLRAAAARVRDLSARQVEFAASDTLSRVCATLTRLADRYGVETPEGLEVATPLSQQELAEWSGMSREAFVKALGRLRKLGWISVEGRVILLRDAAAVARKGGTR